MALALTSRLLAPMGGGKIDALDRGRPQRQNHVLLAIHQPNLAENMI
jgi:hypothetical protein